MLWQLQRKSHGPLLWLVLWLARTAKWEVKTPTGLNYSRTLQYTPDIYYYRGKDCVHFIWAQLVLKSLLKSGNLFLASHFHLWAVAKVKQKQHPDSIIYYTSCLLNCRKSYFMLKTNILKCVRGHHQTGYIMVVHDHLMHNADIVLHQEPWMAFPGYWDLSCCSGSFSSSRAQVHMGPALCHAVREGIAFIALTADRLMLVAIQPLPLHTIQSGAPYGSFAL